MDAAIDRDEAIARFAAFLDQQIATGLQGNRLVRVSLGRGGVICSLQALEKPERFLPLPDASEPRSESA